MCLGLLLLVSGTINQAATKKEQTTQKHVRTNTVEATATKQPRRQHHHQQQHQHGTMTEASPTSTPSSSSTSQTTRASSPDEDNTTTEVGAAAATATTVPTMMTNTTAAPAGGGQGGRVSVGSGRKDPNHTTASSRHNAGSAKNTTATNLFTTTAAMTNLVVSTASSSSSSSSALVLSSMGLTGIVTENNGSGQNDDTHERNNAAAATASPSPSSSVKSGSDILTEAANAMRTVSPPQAETASTEVPHEEECVLCCYLLPLQVDEIQYKHCCGELICDGCIIAQKRTLIIGSNVKQPIASSMEEDLEFIMIHSSKQIMVCPFCRSKISTRDKEFVKTLWKQIDEYNDPKAMEMLGTFYTKGCHGLSTNLKKAEELYQRSYDLGHPSAAYNLANLCLEKIIPDQARTMKYLKEGVKRGNTHCMIQMGWHAAEFGNHELEKQLLTMAACSGHEEAMNKIMKIYRKNPSSVVSKDELATILRVFKVVNDKRKTEAREYALRYKAFDNGLREKKRIDDDYTITTILQYFNSRRPMSQNINETDFLSLIRALAKVRKSHGGV